MKHFIGLLPPYLTLTGVVLSFLIPYVFWKVHAILHKYGDPPWKNSGKPKS